MKNILVYGDSQSWGFVPGAADLKAMHFQRYDFSTRWPGRLQQLMGEDYRIIEENLCGRTTIFDDPILPDRNGLTYLPPCLLSHQPLDLVIIMLGSNDLKPHLGLKANNIAAGMRQLIALLRQSSSGPDGIAPEILVIIPPPIIAGIGQFAASFDGVQATADALAANLQAVCELDECDYLNAADYIEVSSLDGLHPDEKAHALLAEAVADKLKKLSFI